MIAAFQAANPGLRDGLLVEPKMRGRRGLVRAAVVEVDRRRRRQSRAEVMVRLDFFARPAAIADERRGDEEDAAEISFWRIFRKRIDEDGAANRMADEEGAIIKQGEHLIERS